MVFFIKKHINSILNLNKVIPNTQSKKILIVRIYNSTYEYDIMKDIHLKNETNSIFVIYSEIVEDWKYDDKTRTLYIKGKESYIPGILNKTIECIKICRNLFDFDVLVRSNISTVINERILNIKIDSINDSYILGGPLNILTWLDKPAGIDETMLNKIYGLNFISGTGIILSRNICDQILKNEHLLNKSLIDDVSIGMLLKEMDIKINFISPFIIGPLYDNNTIFYRFRTDHIFHNRDNDIRDINLQYYLIKNNL